MFFLRPVRGVSTVSLAIHWKSLFRSNHRHEDISLASAKTIKGICNVNSTIDSSVIHTVFEENLFKRPSETALIIGKTSEDDEETYTFQQIDQHATKLSQWLSGNHLNLTEGNQILVLLPTSNANYSFLQLACVKSNLVFQTINKKNFNEKILRETLKKFPINCIISDVENIDLINRVTHSGLRPLKKALINRKSIGPVTPFSWIRFDRFDSNENEKSTDESLINEKKTINFQHIYPHLFIAHRLQNRNVPRFVWIKTDRNQIALSSWLLGSTVFYQAEIKNEIDLRITFEKYPIDTFSGSNEDFRLLTTNRSLPKKHFKQIFATETIDDEFLREKWRSATNLEISDDLNYEFNEFSSVSKYLSDLENFQNLQK